MSSSLTLTVDEKTTTRIEDSPATKNLEFQATSATLKLLHGYWNRCCRTNNNNNDEWFYRLWELHTEHTRHYHTAVHLLEMCQLFDAAVSSMRSSFNNLDRIMEEDEPYDDTAILLAIFFHDAVYATTSSSNEEDSAKLFRSFAIEAGIRDETTRDVFDWIMATKTHQASVINASNRNLQLFLDLDMAVLGKTSAAYIKYASLIRREYDHVPANDYCEKRATILQSFLQQPHIYSTALFQNALEQRARENLQYEIDSLRRGHIPGSAPPV
jgi:predicted metal-dependent HD superfamily phosphohydrolase